MKINSSQLEAFFTIAKTLNVTRAAEILHVTQSALSQRIAKLENELETTLFIRDRSILRLTEAGEQVLRFCQVNDLAEEELFKKLKSSKEDFAGSLRLGGFSSVNRSLVVPAIKQMMLKNPRLSMKLMTKELQHLENLLKSAEVDYIFNNQNLLSLDIENIFLGFEKYVMIKSKKFSDNEIYLDHDEDDQITELFFSKNKLRIKPKNIRYMDDVYGLIDGVKNGYGKAVLPVHIIKDEQDLEILERDCSLFMPVYLQFYIQPYYRSVHFLFLNEIQRYFKENLSQDIE